MRKVAAYFRSNPVMAVAVAVGIVGVGYFLLTGQQPPAATIQPAPAPATPMAPAAPGPETAPGPAQPPGTPAPVPPATPRPAPGVAAPAGAGRPDPFEPLVRDQPAAPQPGRAVIPPPAPLPPPVFPGQVVPGAPGAPPQPAGTPTPPPKEASTAELIGILGDSGGVAIIKVKGKTYIVNRGDIILNKIRVNIVDALRRLVILEEDGELFELRLGGVSNAHVAASSQPTGT